MAPKPTFGVAAAERDKLLRFFEASNKVRLKAYLDSEGIPTIGWGATSYQDGRPVRMGDTITAGQAESLMRWHIDRSVSNLRREASFAKLNPNQQAALESFAYNAGPNFLSSPNFRTITAAIRSGDTAAITSALKLYTNGGTAGLINRRNAEIKLFLTPYQAPKKTPAAPAAGQPAQEGFNPFKAIQRIFQPNSAAGDLVISPVTKQQTSNKNAADFLSIKPGDFSGKTRSIDSQVKLPGLYDIANASIGNIGRSASGYGSTVFSSSFPAARISERSFGGSMNLGRDLGIRSAASGGYSLPTASSSVGNAWKTGFGIN